jgi:membrane associated rhomboid family serine protease
LFPLRDSVSRSREPVVVWTIVGLNAAVFLYQLTLSGPAEQYFIYRHALVPLRYFSPDWGWNVGLPANDITPFFTAMFLHGGWLHIILNMWTLWIFGPALEDRLGPVRFSMLYLGSGLAASIAHAAFNSGSYQPMLGASGAIAGVIGAYALRFPYAWVRVLVPIVFIPLFFSIPALMFAGIWFLLQVVQGAGELLNPFAGAAGGIAWWAHIGGFITGIVLLRLLEPARHVGGRHAWYNGGPWEQFGRRH